MGKGCGLIMDAHRMSIDQYGRAQQFQQGITLVELVVAVVIVGILVSWAYPGFVGLVQQVRYNESRDALVDSFSMARNEAIFNGRNVVACASNNIHSTAPDCAENQLNWNSGWMIYQECDNDTKLKQSAVVCDLDGNGVADSGERILKTFEPPDFSLIKSDDSAITFLPAGIVDHATEFTIDTGAGSGVVTLTRTANIVASGMSEPYPGSAN